MTQSTNRVSILFNDGNGRIYCAVTSCKVEAPFLRILFLSGDILCIDCSCIHEIYITQEA